MTEYHLRELHPRQWTSALLLGGAHDQQIVPLHAPYPTLYTPDGIYERGPLSTQDQDKPLVYEYVGAR